MLKKLFKYDISAIFKYWWIVAVSSVGVSVIGGISIRALVSLTAKEEPDWLDGWMSLFSVLGILVTVIGISAFIIASEIFVYVRLYKHLFSDEGYLTFTLPVKRRDILISKILSGLIINLATVSVMAFDVLTIIFIGVDHESISEAFSFIGMLIGQTFKLVGPISAAFIAETLILLFCLSVISYLFIAFCLTFAAIIAKKHKLFAAIGIYYAVSLIISFASQLLAMFGSVGLAGIFSGIQSGAITGVLALILFSVCALTAAIAYGLYTLELYLLEKKLNLS